MKIQTLLKKEHELINLHKEKEKIEKIIKRKEEQLAKNIKGKTVRISQKYIKWLDKNVLKDHNYYGSGSKSQRKRALLLEVCKNNLTGIISQVNHRYCAEDELNVKVEFSNGYETILFISDLLDVNS